MIRHPRSCVMRLSVFHLTNRFQVAVRLFSNSSQMTSKCGKSNVRQSNDCSMFNVRKSNARHLHVCPPIDHE